MGAFGVLFVLMLKDHVDGMAFLFGIFDYGWVYAIRSQRGDCSRPTGLYVHNTLYAK